MKYYKEIQEFWQKKDPKNSLAFNVPVEMNYEDYKKKLEEEGWKFGKNDEILKAGNFEKSNGVLRQRAIENVQKNLQSRKQIADLKIEENLKKHKLLPASKFETSVEVKPYWQQGATEDLLKLFNIPDQPEEILKQVNNYQSPDFSYIEKNLQTTADAAKNMTSAISSGEQQVRNATNALNSFGIPDLTQTVINNTTSEKTKEFVNKTVITNNKVKEKELIKEAEKTVLVPTKETVRETTNNFVEHVQTQIPEFTEPFIIERIVPEYKLLAAPEQQNNNGWEYANGFNLYEKFNDLENNNIATLNEPILNVNVTTPEIVTEKINNEVERVVPVESKNLFS